MYIAPIIIPDNKPPTWAAVAIQDDAKISIKTRDTIKNINRLLVITIFFLI